MKVLGYFLIIKFGTSRIRSNSATNWIAMVDWDVVVTVMKRGVLLNSCVLGDTRDSSSSSYSASSLLVSLTF